MLSYKFLMIWQANEEENMSVSKAIDTKVLLVTWNHLISCDSEGPRIKKTTDKFYQKEVRTETREQVVYFLSKNQKAKHEKFAIG